MSVRAVGILLASLMLFSISNADAAEITYIETTHKRAGHYLLKGPIKTGDTLRLRALVQKHTGTNNAFTIHLNSPGGNLYEAFRLGRFIRASQAWADVGPDSFGAPVDTYTESCASACVFVFAGAILHFAGLDGLADSSPTSLIVHRPYLEDAGAVPSLNSAWRQMPIDMRNYLSEMNIPESLADLMLSIEPDKPRPLTKAEVEQFGLSGFDPVEEERLTANSAAFYGLTSGEYRRRMPSARAACQSLFVTAEEAVRIKMTSDQFGEARDKHQDCVDMGLMQLPEEIYRARRSLADSTCEPRNRFCRLRVLTGIKR